MTKQQKIYISFLAAAVAAYLVYLWWSSHQAAAEPQASENASKTGPATPHKSMIKALPVYTRFTGQFPIAQGHTGEEVKRVQRMLNWKLGQLGEKPFYTGKPDGIFGPKTAAALQKAYNFPSVSRDIYVQWCRALKLTTVHDNPSSTFGTW